MSAPESDIHVSLLIETQYQIASLDDFPIRHNFAAAAYDDVPKKILGRKCTMDDVADFVTEYINSDVNTSFSKSVAMADLS